MPPKTDIISGAATKPSSVRLSVTTTAGLTSSARLLRRKTSKSRNHVITKLTMTNHQSPMKNGVSASLPDPASTRRTASRLSLSTVITRLSLTTHSAMRSPKRPVLVMRTADTSALTSPAWPVGVSPVMPTFSVSQAQNTAFPTTPLSVTMR